MSEEKTYTVQQAHRFFAVEANNQTWTYLGKSERSREDDLIMTHLAHTSFYHWLQVGTAVNRARAEWLLSRVYSVLQQPALALAYAQDCLKTSQENNFGDFDIAYAYEAMARAHALNGHRAEVEKYFELATKAGQEIADPEDRAIYEPDLASEPWFGLKPTSAA